MQGLCEESQRARAQEQAPLPTLLMPRLETEPTAVVPATLNLFEKFRCANAPKFEGSIDPLVVDKWLSYI